MATPPSLQDFGHSAMTQNGVPASGHRPLLVLLVEWDENPPISDFHESDYYERLAFEGPVPPFTTRDPVNPASLVDYFLENSHDRFTFEQVAVLGPLRMGPLGADPGPEGRTARILAEVATQSPDLFIGLDADGNSAVEFNELCVLMCENFPEALPANRDNLPIAIQLPVGDLVQTLAVVLHFAGVGPRTPFYQIAHELSHSIGTVDLYNVGAGNYGLTLMSGYDFFSDDQHSVHLDAWHKLRLGWIEPHVGSLSEGGTAEVNESATGSLILYEEGRGSAEFFLLERRTPTSSQRRYDDAVAGDGICLWRVRSGMAAHLGAPALVLGGSKVWPADSCTPALMWEDGTTTGPGLSFATAEGGALRVTW